MTARRMRRASAPGTLHLLPVMSSRSVKDRLDITGARWGLSGAEAVLKLRALRSNGDFDTYWAWHETQEFTRNHQARFRDTLIPAA